MPPVQNSRHRPSLSLLSPEEEDGPSVPKSHTDTTAFLLHPVTGPFPAPHSEIAEAAEGCVFLGRLHTLKALCAW